MLLNQTFRVRPLDILKPKTSPLLDLLISTIPTGSSVEKTVLYN